MGPIQPGDTLILVHEDGGRLAVVHAVTKDGIIERHSMPGQQKYVDARPRDRFIRPRDAMAAAEAIGRFKQIRAERDSAIREAKAKAASAFRSVGFEYDVEEAG